MNWDDMRVFLAVARTESLSGAGRVLKMDPATVGRRVARLEQGMSVTLFAKSPQGYDLTRDGARLLTHAEDAEKAMTLGAADLEGKGDTLNGVIRLGAPDGCANYVLPKVLARIAVQHPDLQVQVVALPRVISLSKREADLVISVSAPQTGRLLVQKITDYHLSLAAMRWYLQQEGEVKTLGDVKNHKIVGYVPDLIFDKELDYLDSVGGATADFSSNTVSVQLNMIKAGLGIGVVHDFCLPHVERMVRILPDDFRLKRAFYLIRHADDRKVERLTRFADLLVSEMKIVVEALEGDA
ncbi:MULTISPECIES: LysR family transcriptional regulator [Pacificibacter]|uniref:LysR family transcriptional regulator n=1 Tax=Pacificibacter TaxID=1042323 RepID=UPI001C08BFCD|nr:MULTISPECIES: LysR family transcriptional regulator [Pacificibacter]MBU2935312.1 LysR family transcriptional regulator [Pacificibacter marinus]MDO6615466.1 LysR family transcriptional regulator [Pacificibacter sp. 1_MG-2023]